MGDFDWHYEDSGLGLRNDEWSWQGSYRGHPSFLIRRSKYDPSVIEDLLPGDLEGAACSILFAQFLECSGGLPIRRMRIASIDRRSAPHDEVVKKYDFVIKVSKAAIQLGGGQVTNSYLDQNRDRWDAVMELTRTLKASK